MKRQSGTKNSAYNDSVGWNIGFGYTKRRSDILFMIGQFFADLVSHNFTDTLDVATKTHSVGLNINITQLRDELVHHSVSL